MMNKKKNKRSLILRLATAVAKQLYVLLFISCFFLAGLMVGYVQGQEGLSRNVETMFSINLTGINNDCPGLSFWEPKNNTFIVVEDVSEDGFYRYFDYLKNSCTIKFMEVK